VIAQLPGTGRCVFVGSSEEAERFAHQSRLMVETGTVEDWRAADIADGIGHVRPGGEGLWLPQELAYDRLGGVSFKKGCYLGQEVVARLHFKGSVKQHPHILQLVKTQGDSTVPVAGSRLSKNGKSLGDLVDAVHFPPHESLRSHEDRPRLVCLAVLRSGDLEEDLTELELDDSHWQVLSDCQV
jgi:folate-binding protein YgfZ